MWKKKARFFFPPLIFTTLNLISTPITPFKNSFNVLGAKNWPVMS